MISLDDDDNLFLFMTKKEIAYKRIKNDIYCRRFHPGDKININALSHQYEMSAIPIREALTLLENEDLVENSPYKGYVVKIPDFSNYHGCRQRYTHEFKTCKNNA